MSTVKMVNLRRPGIGVDLNASVCKFGLVNNWEIPISGNPLNPATPTNGTIVFSATSDVDVVATGDVVIVSTTRAADSTFRSHTVVVSCANGKSGTIVVKQASRIVSLGNHNGASDPTANFYTGTNATAPKLTWNLNDAPVNCQRIRQATEYLNILPTTGDKALPTLLTYLVLSGNNIAWTYSGSLGIRLTALNLNSAFINWSGSVFGNQSTLKPNMTSVQFINYRRPSDTMDYTQLLSMLDSLINNVGTLPTTVIIREQIAANVTAIAAATANETGTDAEKCKYYINFIKSTKGVTTFTLNTTNI